MAAHCTRALEEFQSVTAFTRCKDSGAPESSKDCGEGEQRLYWHKCSQNVKKLFFCVGEYAEYGFDQQRLIWYVCRLWDTVFYFS